MPGKWDKDIAILRASMSLRQMAAHLSIPLGTVASTMARIDGREKDRSDRNRVADRAVYRARRMLTTGKLPTRGNGTCPYRWTDGVLTETWAERKARRQLEKDQRA